MHGLPAPGLADLGDRPPQRQAAADPVVLGGVSDDDGHAGDLTDDVGERRDLSAQRPELVAELRALQQDWEAEVTAQP